MEAFCPAHITGFFIIEDQPEDLLHKGSRGAGFSLSRGTTTRVTLTEESAGSSSRQDRFFMNGKEQKDLPVSRWILDWYRRKMAPEAFGLPERNLPEVETPGTNGPRFRVEHTVEVPGGSGFGTSGAGAFSLALALEKGLIPPEKPSRLRAAQTAHRAEVSHQTGLGTVAGQETGGLELRISPGAPGKGRVESYSLPPGTRALFAVRGPASTSRNLADPEIRRRISLQGAAALNTLRENPCPSLFMELSRRFAEETGLIPPSLRPALRFWDQQGITGSLLMFGEGLFTLLAPGTPGTQKRAETADSRNIETKTSPILNADDTARTQFIHKLIRDTEALGDFSCFVSEVDNKGGRWL